MERDIDYVIITGAGASTALGAAGSRLPMMGEWCNALVEKLLQQNYLGQVGLSRDMQGTQFEERLGRFLRGVTAFAECKEIVLGSTGLPPSAAFATFHAESLPAWYDNTRFHLERVLSVIRECLYEEFAERRYDPARAQHAYRNLFDVLRISNSSRVVLATTNYDIIGETALELLDFNPDWGETASPDNPQQRRIRVDGLLDGIPRHIPVLHIHGRVGWYRRLDGLEPELYSTPATRHQDGFGVPIVMLPDPNKVYEDPVIASLWSQFVAALDRAKRVVVLGHSLNDALLVDAIAERVPDKQIALCLLGKPDEPSVIEEGAASPLIELARRRFPSAALIPLRFGEADLAAPTVHDWLERTQQ
jgi:hypothetical protein